MYYHMLVCEYMEKVKHILQHAGLKATKSRCEVLAFLIEHHGPISIEEMQKKLAKKSPDRVTLYRMMQQYYLAGIINRVDFREGFERFEFQDHHHHHIVCTGCGRIEDFESCIVKNISSNVLKESKYFKGITDHSLELFGLCNKCVRI